MKLSIRAGLIVIALCAVAFTGARAFLLQPWCPHDEIVRLAFANDFAGRPTFENVGTRLGSTAQEKSHDWVVKQIESNAFQCPHGIDDGDRFLWSDEYGRACLLHFRKQRLINVDTAWLRTVAVNANNGGHHAAH